ncbi:MBL fold metallo-hydrolase [Candidatus Parcubacteria bacterium]|nr:MBL fold metallo-hydrolase [Candidatus Parcubacteria bacterium]
MPHKLYKTLITLAIVGIFLAIPVFWLTLSAENKLEIAFLDVGQGDASLIKTPFGQNILIDGGADYKVIEELEKELQWWDKSVDLMVLTHPHDDHVAGLIFVLERYDVKKILYTGVTHSAPAYLEWLKIVKAKNVPLVIIDRPQKIIFGNDCFLDIIYPRQSLLGKSVNNLNNSSIVAELACVDKTVLFMGDAEIEVEEELIKTGNLNRVEILKVGHHGSNTSSHQEFLELGNPQKAIISVGKDNKFGHPSQRIIKRLERLGAEILRTDLNGTIRF